MMTVRCFTPAGNLARTLAGWCRTSCTDGDVRRAIERDLDINTSLVQQVMKHDPVTVREDAAINLALELMENRPSQISVLPVTDEAGNLVGLVRLHDIYQLND